MVQMTNGPAKKHLDIVPQGSSPVVLATLIRLAHTNSLGRKRLGRREVQDLGRRDRRTRLGVSCQSNPGPLQTSNLLPNISLDSGRDLGLLPTHPGTLSCSRQY